MFAYLEGIAEARGHSVVWLKPDGLGICFELAASPLLVVASTAVKTRAYIYEHRTENVRRLYGFASEEERVLFCALLDCDGVGPKSALSILSLGKPSDIWQSIRLGQAIYLRRAKGIGDKAANSIILKLAHSAAAQEAGRKGNGNGTTACLGLDG